MTESAVNPAISTTEADAFERFFVEARGIPSWVLADQELIRCLVLGRLVVHGRSGRRVVRILRALRGAGFEVGLVYLIGAATALRLWLRVGRSQRELPPPPRLRAMLGFGAGSERLVWEEFQTAEDSPAVLLQIWDPASWRILGRPRLRELFTELQQAIRDVKGAARRLGEASPSLRDEVLTSCAKRIGWLVYSSAVWRRSRFRVTALQSLAPDTITCAAIDVGVPTTFRQHGFILRSVHIPAFREIAALSRDEAAHFETRVPHVPIKLHPAGSALSSVDPRTVLIASIYGFPEEMPLIDEFVEWARSKEMRIVVRPHPRESGDFWRARASVVEIISSDEPFEILLARRRPWCMASWHSTVLLQALQSGVLPITVLPEGARPIRDLVYPLRQRSVCWPEQRTLLEEASESEVARDSILGQLRA